MTGKGLHQTVRARWDGAKPRLEPRIDPLQTRTVMTDFANATPSAVDIVKRENCFQGFYKLDRVHLRHELFAGGMSREISRELFVRHDAVCVLPYDPKRDEVEIGRAHV